ncbi:zinc finger SWIM domain-containing protein 8 [Lates japonicus]|uniref:Zinc finger SWIM domain-containing protein 8 n=1 Tax=Lates japonicus TaxID=270547 RepID=A0AAD3N365_LATJO|nr:zinc finger SWIM domain-containing protein 8 [Lates japonicus]
MLTFHLCPGSCCGSEPSSLIGSGPHSLVRCLSRTNTDVPNDVKLKVSCQWSVKPVQVSFSGMSRLGGLRGFSPKALTTGTDTTTAERLHKLQATLQRDTSMYRDTCTAA